MMISMRKHIIRNVTRTNSTGTVTKVNAFTSHFFSTNHFRNDEFVYQAIGAIVIRCSSSYSRSRRKRERAHKHRKGNNHHHGFKLDALPFSISPEEALQKFNKWAVDEQGLYYLLRWSSIRIVPTYLPVWSFDVNLRFIVTNTDSKSTKKKRYDWKPSIFSDGYGKDKTVLHIPGLASYAGYSYRRSLINPLVNTTLVFMGNETQPFGNWMLRDMNMSTTNGTEQLQVEPDVWNATRGQSFQFLFGDLEILAKQELGQAGGEGEMNVEVQSEIVSSRRVYLPAYYIDYSLLGIEYRVFVSGCDTAAEISGVSHKVVDSSAYSSHQIRQQSANFLSKVSSVTEFSFRNFNTRQLAGIVQTGVLLLGNVVVRLFARLPIVGLFIGGFVGFRKIIQPWMDNRRATADWERQRDHETHTKEDHSNAFHAFGNDFVDHSGAQKYFMENRARILKVLSGSYSHEQGDFDWYKEWEEWARRQWEQQQQQQSSSQNTYSQQQQQQKKKYSNNQRQQRQQKNEKKQEYQWDFDVNDSYSVLGIQYGATKSEISVAFRREMLKHHPDTQTGASEATKARAEERSKLITAAYRKIKSGKK